MEFDPVDASGVVSVRGRRVLIMGQVTVREADGVYTLDMGGSRTYMNDEGLEYDDIVGTPFEAAVKAALVADFMACAATPRQQRAQEKREARIKAARQAEVIREVRALMGAKIPKIKNGTGQP